MAEGLFFFLTETQAATLLRTLRQVSAPGSGLVTDMVSEQLLRNPFNRTFLTALGEDGTPGCSAPTNRRNSWTPTAGRPAS
ncbi:hypothetical protein ACFQ2B_05380 [Streptomyces stramineus]